LQAVIGDDSFDAALADRMALLADFLSDDFGGRIRIEEAAADDQAHDLTGAAVIGFGSRGLEEQALGALLQIGRQDLVITLAGEIKFFSGLGRAEAFALALDEHGQAPRDLVVFGDQKGAARAGEAELISGQRNIHRWRVVRGRVVRQIECGCIIRLEAVARSNLDSMIPAFI